ncbi:MAG: ATP-binding cassette domain-containing protein [Knoellia sp.]
MTVSEPLAVCHNVARTFGTGPSALVAVHGSSCSVSPDDLVALVGPSGSGKSTLLHLLAGLELPTAGTVTWPALSQDPAQRVHEIGVVFQSPSLIPTLDVRENVALPLVLQGLDPQECSERAQEALSLLGLTTLAPLLPEEISGGQAQRVAAARVLAQRPRLVLADEPTGQLDHATGQSLVTTLVDTVTHIGAALVISTHDESVLTHLTTRWVMADGRLTLPADREYAS